MRIAGTGHAGIQVNLLESGARVRLDHLLSFGHCLGGGLPLPRIWPQMVAPQDHPRRIEALAFCNLQHQPAKVLRLHPGIPTVVVDLVGSGLD